jgi:diaminopimelate decarboxylase
MVRINKKEILEITSKWETPIFLYDEKEIIKRIHLVKKAFNCAPFKILYALKANSNVSLLRIFKKEGCKIDASSPGDAFLALEAGFCNSDIYATGPNWTDKELKYFIDKEIAVDLDSVSHVRRYGKIFPGKKIGIRINPGLGSSSFAHIRAGGNSSKLGIALRDVENTLKEAESHRLVINGLHAHIGSSSFDVKPFIKSLDILLSLAKKMPAIEFINIGGGCGVGFGKDEKDFDIADYGKRTTKIINAFSKKEKRKIELRIELGEFLMWPCACAIGKVNTVKYNHGKKFIGIDVNSNHIPTPYLYDSHHMINVFNKRKKEKVDVAGNLCQAGDILARDRFINEIRESDYIAIQNAGAYCIARASHFNSRLLPKEVLRTKEGRFVLIREEKLSDLLQGQIYEKK